MSAAIREINETVKNLARLEAIKKLEAARKIDAGIGEWIAAELLSGHSPEYVWSHLKAALEELRRQKEARS